MTATAAATTPGRITKADVLRAAEQYIHQTGGVYLLQHGDKKPVSDESKPRGDQWVSALEPDELQPAIDRWFPNGELPNLSIGLAPKLDSVLVAVDIDGADAETVRVLRDLGVNSDSATWIQQTGGGKGHHHVIYQYVGEPLPRRVRPDKSVPFDLLTNGMLIVAPSNTYRWRGSGGRRGGPYVWLPGHSPSDIHHGDLDELPAPLLEYWQELALDASSASGTSGSSKMWAQLGDTIPAGSRNSELTRFAGWLRAYHPLPVLEQLLLVINDARCDPPLPMQDVLTIARSVARYPQTGVNGHPRAVVPTFYREE